MNGLIALTLMVIGFASKEPLYYIAAGIYELADVIYVCFKNRR